MCLLKNEKLQMFDIFKYICGINLCNHNKEQSSNVSVLYYLYLYYIYIYIDIDIDVNFLLSF